MITNTLQSFINYKKIDSIKAILSLYIAEDRSMNKFTKALREVEKQLRDEIYDAHDGRKYPCYRDRWSDEYFHIQLIYLEDNFSKERIEFIKDMLGLNPKKENNNHNNEGEKVEEK